LRGTPCTTCTALEAHTLCSHKAIIGWIRDFHLIALAHLDELRWNVFSNLRRAQGWLRRSWVNIEHANARAGWVFTGLLLIQAIDCCSQKRRAFRDTCITDCALALLDNHGSRTFPKSGDLTNSRFSHCLQATNDLV
jgi:hypothetical protein